MLLAIDPGPERSAYLWFHANQPANPACEWDWIDNERLLVMLRDWSAISDRDHLAIEMVASYGMPVGCEVFDTCVTIGRFIEAFRGPHTMVYRRDVKVHLCGTARAKDANVRQALIDKYGATKREAIGLKRAPGPLYGLKSHGWAALAVAVTWTETRSKENDDAE